MPRIENGGNGKKKGLGGITKWPPVGFENIMGQRGKRVERITPTEAVRRLSQMGAGLGYPTPPEFNERLRQIMAQNFPLTQQGLEFLNRINFQFMPGEPGWASSRELGAAIDPGTVVHEYLHNFPTFGMRGVFAGREQARVSPFDPTEYQRRFLQGYMARPDAYRELGLINPAHIGQLSKELFLSPWHGYTTPLELSTRLPEDLRRTIYPFVQPGVSPRAFLGRPEGPPSGFAWPELVYADVAQNPQRYLEHFMQDPDFWSLVFLPRLKRTMMTRAFER